LIFFAQRVAAAWQTNFCKKKEGLAANVIKIRVRPAGE